MIGMRERWERWRMRRFGAVAITCDMCRGCGCEWCNEVGCTYEPVYWRHVVSDRFWSLYHWLLGRAFVRCRACGWPLWLLGRKVGRHASPACVEANLPF